MVGSPAWEGLRFKPHSAGPDHPSSVLIMYWFLVVIAGNLFLSDLSYVLSAECVLGYGVKVARGAEMLGWPCRAACLGGRGRDCLVCSLCLI